MWRIEAGAGGRRGEAPDVVRFIQTVNAHGDYFDSAAPVLVARAPGRLDLMGGIADYSGALVLELPLGVATFVAAQPTSDGRLTVRSLAVGPGADSSVIVPIVALDHAEIGRLVGNDPRRRWAAYVLGGVPVLRRERGIHVGGGLRLLVDSSVPSSKGVSSSAALEVASMSAICAAVGVRLEPRDLALLCQMVENQVVGAPCGVMDQMTAACGACDRLLALLCQPAELEGQVALPPTLEVWGIDSGIRHEVGGADYTGVRVGAFMGYRIIAAVARLAVKEVAHGRVQIVDPKWKGYLANVTPSEWESTFSDFVPEDMDGASFLRGFGGISDPVTEVDARRVYRVRHPTAHPIYEHDRVQRFRDLLAAGAVTEEERVQLGELMYQSHASYGACGLGSSGTDLLVTLVREAGPAAGFYGAKITGGGSGGVVAVLARAGSRARVDAIADSYERLTGRGAMVLGGSSDGAARFGVLRLCR